ncbi:2OG-Fe(II) oxygenase-like protein 1 [Elsinoe fawcettii]|nr:2OG-Fe(II) oxygenase-like protein 1 [Elsinoe fawcettii]
MASNIDCSDLVPVPFPEDVPAVTLPSVSLAKLLAQDTDEASRVTEIMRTSCFFTLDLLDHQKGIEFYKDILDCTRFARETFDNTSVKDKQDYKRREGSVVLDKGYTTALGTFDDNDRPIAHETLNVPSMEVFNGSASSDLPSWLSVEEKLFKRIFERAFEITHAILKAFQTALQVSGQDMLTSHDMLTPSGHTIRMLHYTTSTYDKIHGLPTLAAHRDWTSLTLVFNWLGGLQIPKPDARWLHDDAIHEEDWDWVKPVPGTTIVNAGEALQRLTGRMIKSGLHRVVPAPAPQDHFDRYSIFLGIRPRNDWPMRPYDSPLIPNRVDGQDFSHMTCEEWGAYSIEKWVEAAQARARAVLQTA